MFVGFKIFPIDMIMPAHKPTCEPGRPQNVFTDLHVQNSKTLPRLLLTLWISLFSQIVSSFRECIYSSTVVDLTWLCKSCTRSLASTSSCSATLLLLSVCSKDARSSSISACSRLALRSTMASCSLRSSWLLMASSRCSWVSYTERENDSCSCFNESKYQFRVMYTRWF